MEIMDYKKYVASTVLAYSSKYQKHVKKLFLEAGLVSEKEQLRLETLHSIDIAGLPLQAQLEKCISESEDALGVVENWEFVKDYKYSVLFTAENAKYYLQFSRQLDPVA